MSLDATLDVALGSLVLDVAITIGEGEVVAVLGPNGAGKTTLMRAIAGLLPLRGGHVRLDGQMLEDVASHQYVPTDKRSIGVVFQDYLLFPHLTVRENVAFGLRSRGVARRSASERANEWLERLGLVSYADARPAQLSGGQRQRVALARALAPKPRLLLLDEPLSALDLTTRAEVRRDLRRHIGSFPGLRLLVTHDPLEAAALADRLVVIEQGRMVQSGTSEEITERPRSQYVAELVGVNLLKGRAEHGSIRLANGSVVAAAAAEPGDVFVTVHPRAVAVHRHKPEGSPRNVWHGRIAGLDRMGDRVRVRIEGDVSIVAEVTSAALSELQLGEGEGAWLSFKATDVGVYPA